MQRLKFSNYIDFYKSNVSNFIVRFNNTSIEIIVLFSVSNNFFVSWYLQQIRNINYGTSSGFFHIDTNCSEIKLSKIQHCFGDFQIFLPSNNVSRDILLAREIYPPTSQIFFYPFDLLSRILTNNFSLFVFLIIPIILNIFGSHYFLRSNNLKSNLFVLACINFTSLPILVAFERGNSNIYLPFLFILFLIGCRIKNDRYIYIGFALMVLIKPQYMVLVFYFILINRFRLAVKFLFLFIFSNIFLSYIMYDSAFRFVEKFFTSLDTLNSVSNISDLWPINISPAHTLSKVGIKIGLEIDSFTYTISATILLLIFIALLYYLLKNLSIRDLISISPYLILFCLFFTFFIYTHSPIYYLIFAPIFLFFFHYNNSFFNSIYLVFITRVNLIFMTFYFPFYRSSAVLSRFEDRISIFLTYNSYVLLTLNIIFIFLLIGVLYRIGQPRVLSKSKY